MRIETAIKTMYTPPRPWVRLQSGKRTSDGLDLVFDSCRGRDGKVLHSWMVRCLEVREARITYHDWGGILVAGSSHAAARQYTSRGASLQWRTKESHACIVGVIHQAHIDAVDDWIPLERYAPIQSARFEPAQPSPSGLYSCKGPGFLLRAYARALRPHCMQVKLVMKAARKREKLRVLHFSESFVVAGSFTAERVDPGR